MMQLNIIHCRGNTMSYSKKRSRQCLVLICLFCITVFAHAKLPTGYNQAINPGEIPDGISTRDWGSIQAQVKAGKYKAYSDHNGGYDSSNPAHGWQIGYGVDGTTTLSPRDRNTADYRLSFKLSAIGYESLETLNRPQQISSQDNTLNYHWNATLTERWINSETNLEQWFILNQRPEGAASGQSLTLQLTVDTDLTATQQGNNIRFVNTSGTTTITYDKLKVWDADRHNLPAEMKLTGQQLSLIVDDSTARYPLTIDPSFEQQAKLNATNADSRDSFGTSVAISGDTLVVGASGEDSNATGVDGDQTDNSAEDAGAAYVFTRIGDIWSQQAYLKASNTESDDFFGVSVAIVGDTVVVGALEDSNATGVDGEQNDNSANGAGAAYVFTRNGGVWSQQAYLKASNTDEFDFFGRSVAISGNTLVVGAVHETSNATGVNGDQNDNSAERAGAAYVFTRSGDIWSQQAYLKASNSNGLNSPNTFFGDSFGSSVAITAMPLT